MITDRSAFDVADTERRDFYEAAWAKGGLQFRAAFRDLLMSKEANDTAAEFLKSKIREVVKDPETARKLSNIDHPYAAKRPPIDRTTSRRSTGRTCLSWTCAKIRSRRSRQRHPHAVGHRASSRHHPSSPPALTP